MWRRPWSSDPGNSDIARQTVTGSEQILNDGTDIRFGEELSLRYLATGKGIDLTQQMVVTVMRE